MAETTADVRRDIELTRERMSTTMQQLEQKLNVMQVVRDNPWPALALAVGAGVLLSGSRNDVKTAAATTAMTRGAGSRVGSVLDDVVSHLVTGLHAAVDSRIMALVDDLKTSIGVPTGQPSGERGTTTDTTPRASTVSDNADRFDRSAARDVGGHLGIQPTRAD